MHIFSESSQNFIACSNFLFPRFMNDSSISLWRFLNVPLKKNNNPKMLGSGHWTYGNWLHKVWTVGWCQLLVRRAPSPLFENGSEHGEDTAHPTAYRGHSVIFCSPTDGQALYNSLLPSEGLWTSGCRIMCSCFAQMDSTWIPCQKSAMNFTKQCLVARHSGLWYLCKLSHQDLAL